MSEKPFYLEEAAGYHPAEYGLHRPYEVAQVFGAPICEGLTYTWTSPTSPVVTKCSNDLEALKARGRNWYKTEQGINVSVCPGIVTETATGVIVYDGGVPSEIAGLPLTPVYQSHLAGKAEAAAGTTTTMTTHLVPWLAGEMVPSVPNWVLIGIGIFAFIGLAVYGGLTEDAAKSIKKVTT